MAPSDERPPVPAGGGRPDARAGTRDGRPSVPAGGGQLDARAGADWTIARLAGDQHGVVARWQLLAAGVSSRAIERRLARGRLHRVRRGVYLVGHAASSPLAPVISAVLAAGDGALLGCRAATRHWEMLPPAGGPIDVLVPAPRHPRLGGIRVLRSGRIPDADRRVHRGVPVTAPARSLADLAAAVPHDTLARAVEEGLRLRLVTLAELERAAAGRSRSRGNASLIRALAEHRPAAFTRSEAERRLVELVRAAGLDAPLTNARVAGFEVDALWRAQRLIAEVDGYAYHGTRAAFERDRRKDAALLAGGWRVVRLSWRQIADEPERIVALLARLLAAPR